MLQCSVREELIVQQTEIKTKRVLSLSREGTGILIVIRKLWAKRANLRFSNSSDVISQSNGSLIGVGFTYGKLASKSMKPRQGLEEEKQQRIVALKYP